MSNTMQNEIVFDQRQKDRRVADALQMVTQWRQIYENGIIDQNGNQQYFTLQDAAKEINCSKKTLEDYYQVFRKINLISNLDNFLDKKMGDLRQYLKTHKSLLKKELKIQVQQKQSEKKHRQKLKRILKKEEKIIKQLNLSTNQSQQQENQNYIQDSQFPQYNYVDSHSQSLIE